MILLVRLDYDGPRPVRLASSVPPPLDRRFIAVAIGCANRWQLLEDLPWIRKVRREQRLPVAVALGADVACA